MLVECAARAGNQKDRDARPSFGNNASQLLTGESGHQHSADDETYTLPQGGQQRNRLNASSRLHYAEARVAEHARQVAPLGIVTVHHHDEG